MDFWQSQFKPLKYIKSQKNVDAKIENFEKFVLKKSGQHVQHSLGAGKSNFELRKQGFTKIFAIPNQRLHDPGFLRVKKIFSKRKFSRNGKVSSQLFIIMYLLPIESCIMHARFPFYEFFGQYLYFLLFIELVHDILGSSPPSG